MKKEEKYPEELTMTKFENIDWKYTKMFENTDADDVERHSKRMHGSIIYTQVDADGEIVYLKGLNIVNRTGVWQVVKR